MKNITLVTGGCRSGKSGYALKLAGCNENGKKVFIATCVPRDDEMRSRVEKHRQERGKGWETVECPLDLAGAIKRVEPGTNVILIDCLTLWTSNLLEQTQDTAAIMEHVKSLRNAMDRARSDIIIVTNEVGSGIVPENPLARHFRDVMGMVNSSMAAFADRVVWMVAGIPVVVKGETG
ncbi:MAG: bifunctional adenosylcobinamide kinase/adenosylcobinamide-phosphate guanylyltransferase [Desulfococcus sp. 4484_241]|nr:MAG: bifunctional adenosylcobinamide kinase/adenosylcobinamide-phosphate guanylyltransferase [Desulfococcus sp. 4484_241]